MQSQGEPAGEFCFDVATRTWDWDDAVFRLHGYDPDDVVPTTELVTECKDPADTERLRDVLGRCERTAEHFAISYEHVGGDGTARRLVMVGRGMPTATGTVASVDGHFIDLSAMVAADHAETRADDQQALARVAETRSVIEQAKGAVMLAYALDGEAAFAMLRWWSRDRNVKVRDLADRLVGRLGQDGVTTPALRATLDAWLHDLTS